MCMRMCVECVCIRVLFGCVCVFVVPNANPNSRLMASRHNPVKNAHTTMLLSSSTVAEIIGRMDRGGREKGRGPCKGGVMKKMETVYERGKKRKNNDRGKAAFFEKDTIEI